MKNIEFTVAENEARKGSVYDLLLAKGNVWTTMEECTDSINLYPAFFTGDYHNSDTRRLLSKDIRDINLDPEYEKVIVHGINGNKGIKLGTESEAIEYLNSCKKEAIRKLALANAIAKKISRDQQLNLQGEIAEAFLKE